MMFKANEKKWEHVGAITSVEVKDRFFVSDKSKTPSSLQLLTVRDIDYDRED